MEDEMGRHVAWMGELRSSERKRPLGRHRHGWEYNIRMDVRKPGGSVWTGCIWLRIGTSGGPL
jgi:hypothetical protein